MQFRLANLFTLTAICGMLAAFASLVLRHWDLRSVYLGYYGADGVPDWATGTGRDSFAEAFGALAHVGIDYAPWILLMALCCIAGAFGIHVKGGAR